MKDYFDHMATQGKGPEYIEPDFDTSPAYEVQEFSWDEAPAALRAHFASMALVSSDCR